MSEDNPQTQSGDNDSSVPLKKETTRVTLKAPEGSAPPPPAPGAPPAPKAPPAPGAPPAPAPPQATQPLTPAAPAAQPTGAKTVPLNPTPAASSPSQATVKLQPSSPSSPSLPGSAAPLSTGNLSATLDDDGEDKGLTLIAAICLVLAFAAILIETLGLPMMMGKKTTSNEDPGLLSIPYNDYDRKFVFVNEDDPEKGFNFKFTKYTPEGGPKNLFDQGLDEYMEIEDYEDYKNEKN
jgi:hypothetical protein